MGPTGVVAICHCWASVYHSAELWWRLSEPAHSALPWSIPLMHGQDFQLAAFIAKQNAAWPNFITRTRNELP